MERRLHALNMNVFRLNSYIAMIEINLAAIFSLTFLKTRIRWTIIQILTSSSSEVCIAIAHEGSLSICTDSISTTDTYIIYVILFAWVSAQYVEIFHKHKYFYKTKTNENTSIRVKYSYTYCRTSVINCLLYFKCSVNIKDNSTIYLKI